MNKKNCFLVLAYTPSIDKELALINLLKQIRGYEYPVIVSSHNVQSNSALELATHYLFDSNDELLNYYPIKGEEFNPKIDYKTTVGDITIYSSFTSIMKYHGLSAASLLFNGLILAKTLGYEKCHVLEYDSELNSIDEFIHNEGLLDSHGSVHYFCGPHEWMAFGSICSFNLNNYSFDDLAWTSNKKYLKDIIGSLDNGVNNGMVEVAISSLLHKPKNSFRKTREDLENSKVIIDLSHKRAFDNKDKIEIIPFRLGTDVCVLVQMLNSVTGKRHDVKIILNDTRVFNCSIVNSGEWNHFKVCTFEELRKITVILNDNIIKTFDFVNDIDKEYFYGYSVGTT